MAVICSVLAAFPLPDWMFYECRSIRKGGELIIQLTEVFLWWVSSRGAGGRCVCPYVRMCVCVCVEGRERWWCNKAECISPGMTLQRLEGAEEREEGGW